MKKFTLLIAALSISILSIWAQPVPGNPVTTIDSIAVCQGGTTVDIAITVSDFTAVGNISLTFTYTSSEIYSPSIINVNPGIVAWTTYAANTSVADTITFSAYDPDIVEPVTGLTLADGDTLFMLRFTLGTINDFANILFYENSEGSSCELGGIGPDFTPFTDTPQGTYYIPGVVDVVDVDPGIVASAQFICEGGDAAAFSSTADASGEGIITYQWQMSITSETEGYSNIDGANSSTYDAGFLTADTWFRREASSVFNGVTCSANSNVVLVTVINLDPEQIVSNQTICEGEDPAAFQTNYASGDGTITYQWQSSTVSEFEGFTDIVGATLFYYDADPLTEDTWFRREATATLGGTECVEYSNVLKITVINFDPGTVSGDQTLCAGEDVSVFLSVSEAAGDGIITYQWQKSTISASTGFTDISGATASTFDEGIVTVDSWYRRVALSLVNGETCSEFSNVIAISVADLDPGSIGSAQYIGEGDDPAALTSVSDATGDGTPSYQWQVSTTSESVGFSIIDGATASTYDPGVLFADAWYRRESSATYESVTCVEYSNVIAVTVINFEAGTISGDQATCQDEAVMQLTSVADASGDGTLSYQWQSSTTGETIGFSDIAGATTSVYEPGIISVDTWFRREATASMGGTELSKFSNVAFISIIDIAPGSIGSDQTICAGENTVAFTSISEATGEGTLAYQWQMSTSGASEGFADITGATTSTFDPGAVAVDTWFRRAVSTSVSGTECVKYSNVVKITANPLRTLSGQVYYYNSSGNVLMIEQDVSVSLYLCSDLAHENMVASVITDINGYYEFTDLCSGRDYDIVATSISSTYGSINTTDAAQTNYWGAHYSTIEKVKFYAGDVGTSGVDQDLSVNSTDAGRIQQNFVYGYAFDRLWTFWKAGTTISANPATVSYPWVHLATTANMSQDLYGLCTGDFNRSFNPGTMKSASSTLDLVQLGNRLVTGMQEFELPVRMVNPSMVGAISLILNIPADDLEVTDVVVPGNSGQLDWTTNGDELRIGWNAAVPLYLTENSEMLIIHFRAKASFNASAPVLITLANDPLNELADETYNVIGNAVLSVETINGNALGIGDPETGKEFMINNYPNPFTGSTRLVYILPESGRVILEIYNLLGVKSASILNEIQPAGHHEIVIGQEEFPSGIYFVKIIHKSDTGVFMKTHKVIKN